MKKFISYSIPIDDIVSFPIEIHMHVSVIARLTLVTPVDIRIFFALSLTLLEFLLHIDFVVWNDNGMRLIVLKECTDKWNT